jgi:hypothetical protein
MLAIRWRFVGRFTGAGLATATVAASQGTRVADRNLARHELVIYNAGNAPAYLTDQPGVSTADSVIPPGAVRQWEAGRAPYNELWASGAAGADLRVDESVRVTI